MWPDFPSLYWDVDVCVSRSPSTTWDFEKSLGSLNFAHVMQVCIPNAYRLPDYVRNLFLAQQYQVVRSLTLKELVAWDFLVAFVKRGSLFGLSVNTDLSTGQCVAVTPDVGRVLRRAKAALWSASSLGSPSTVSSVGGLVRHPLFCWSRHLELSVSSRAPHEPLPSSSSPLSAPSLRVPCGSLSPTLPSPQASKSGGVRSIRSHWAESLDSRSLISASLVTVDVRQVVRELLVGGLDELPLPPQVRGQVAVRLLGG
ncbi:hypothetical protein HPB47_026611 [Ixodes persulcatus]|uniref:Uncharacterized protein n=1 Tax=Ixodes persulcatus TaxID=34615 RepID=A0AC60PYL4_IXOPE|nr:hypothetical protein HPB47_026611 [Ixodes persulcatus]